MASDEHNTERNMSDNVDKAKAWDVIAEKNAELNWLRSSLVTLLNLAEAEKSPLNAEQVAAICKVALSQRAAA